MERNIPESLKIFLKNGLKDVDDGYEFCSELNRIINSDACQQVLSSKELELLREFAERVKKVGEINYYSEEKIKEIEKDMFGNSGVQGFLGLTEIVKPQWPF